LNPAAVASCRERHDVPGLDFVHGNAEDLPFAVETFDAVVNVESSHCYPHFSRFLAEVARVLRPGGHFLYTDLRPRLGIADWEASLAGAPLRMVSERVINAEVLRALDERSQGSLELLSRQLPGPLQGIGREAYHVKGSRFYRDLNSGEFSWRMYCLIKD
jgi:SAM-dependent methyltransferase